MASSEPIVVLTMTRSEFDKLSAGWFKAQTLTGPCYCDTCENVSDILADVMEELMTFDEMVAEMEEDEERSM